MRRESNTLHTEGLSRIAEQGSSGLTEQCPQRAQSQLLQQAPDSPDRVLHGAAPTSTWCPAKGPVNTPTDTALEEE